MNYIENNPTDVKHSKQKGNVEIVRLSPFLDGVEVEFKSDEPKNIYIKLLISELCSGKDVFSKIFYQGEKFLKATGLAANIDFVAEVVILNENMDEIARSNARLFRCGFYPGKVINYIHPSDKTYVRSGEFIGSPHIVKMDNGSYIVSHDVFSHDNTGHSSLCKFFVSKDYGKTWSYLSEIEHCTWGTMFKHNGMLYIIGTSAVEGGGGDVILYSSSDEAASWSEPVVLARKNQYITYRTATTSISVLKNRLYMYIGAYTTIDENKKGTLVRGETVQAGKALGAAVLSIDLTDEISEKNCTLSEPTLYNPKWEGAAPMWFPIMMEEGNVVVADDKIKIILRCNSHRYDTPVTDPENIKYLVFKVDENNLKAAPVFEKAVPFNGALHKFYIQYDEKNNRYLALVNRITNDKIWQRNVISLAESKDLEKWSFIRDLVNLEDINWHEDSLECGVQYPVFFVENDKIITVLRTAINGADNFHNSNAVTFHEFNNIFDKYKY